MASRAHISISDSNMMADFEREALINITVKDIKQQVENDKKAKNPLGN